MTDKKRTSAQAFGDEESSVNKHPIYDEIATPPLSSVDPAHGDFDDKVALKTQTPSTSTEIAPVEAVNGSENSDKSVTLETEDDFPARPQTSRESVLTNLSANESHVSEVAEADELEPITNFMVLADLIDTSARRCTYQQGYVKRQLVYACRTCTLDVLEPAGMCLACALNCHDEHDLVALLTRRDFRCDCGNTKFGPRKCQLTLNKDPTNDRNVYNDNFHGKVCVCQKPIDNNVVGEEHETVQCRICEQQFHPAHIGVEPAEFGEDRDGELACTKCLTKYPFLQLYAVYLSNTKAVTLPEQRACLLAELRKALGGQGLAKKGMVMPAKWFEQLCKCAECSNLYQTNKISFLLDPDDTCAAYEEREGLREMENVRRASQMTPDEIFAQICEGFDPVTQVELAHWFNNLREVFVEFLRSRLDQGQVITETDIEEFFRSFSTQEDGDG